MANNEYIPTTEVVRGVYATPQEGLSDEQSERVRADREAFFDRWLEQYTESLREQWDWAARDGAES